MKFWEHVQRGDGCWLWIGSLNTQGYGRVNHGHVKKSLAHRMAWELTNGPIPAGLCVLHRCDNPPCVKPEHLFLGTRADNGHDRNMKGRTVSRRGEAAGKAVLTQRGVIDARAAHAGGATIKKLAEAFGVSESSMWGAVHGRSWRWLPGALPVNHASDEQARKAVERL